MWEGGWAKWVRGTKESTPEISVALDANSFGCKLKKKKKKVKQVKIKKKSQSSSISDQKIF